MAPESASAKSPAFLARLRRHALWMLRSSGLEEAVGVSICPETVGWKAYGLACLPIAWVPPLLVVDAAITSLDEAVLSALINAALSERGF